MPPSPPSLPCASCRACRRSTPRDATGGITRLAPALARLRREGAPFSLTISTPDGVFVEVDGRTAGARAVVWIIDASVRGVEEGGARGRIEGARQVIARDPAAFLEMWTQAPFMAWRVNGALKLEWANPDYLNALEAKSLEQAIARNLQLDQAAADLARKAIESGEAVEETRSAVVGGQLRTLRLRMSPVAGGAAGMAIDVTEVEASRELLSRAAARARRNARTTSPKASPCSMRKSGSCSTIARSSRCGSSIPPSCRIAPATRRGSII